MKGVREQLRNYGVEVETKYLIYRTQDRVLAIPYFHIRTLELKDNRLVIYAGSVERIVIELPHEGLSRALFEELLLHIERLYL